KTKQPKTHYRDTNQHTHMDNLHPRRIDFSAQGIQNYKFQIFAALAEVPHLNRYIRLEKRNREYSTVKAPTQVKPILRELPHIT
ncbi:MAG: hypothetical protein Q4G30_06305, partial [Actinomycetaceae bacterium]|nr:hypothetical protein [Actinomycetaceae bacterium]